MSEIVARGGRNPTLFYTAGYPPKQEIFIIHTCILANCSYYIGTVPFLTQKKGRKKSDFIMCSYFCKNLPVVMYRKFRNVPIFKDIPPICPYFLGFRVGKYAYM